MICLGFAHRPKGKVIGSRSYFFNQKK